MNNIKRDLIKLANRLDQLGLTKEADILDAIVKTAKIDTFLTPEPTTPRLVAPPNPHRINAPVGSVIKDPDGKYTYTVDSDFQFTFEKTGVPGKFVVTPQSSFKDGGSWDDAARKVNEIYNKQNPEQMNVQFDQKKKEQLDKFLKDNPQLILAPTHEKYKKFLEHYSKKT